MRARLGLRARLTIAVTTVFAIALVVSTVVVVRAVEARLVEDTRASAEAVLVSYLDSLHGGVATVGVVDPDETTRFFYLDDNGQELSTEEYFETMSTGFSFESVAVSDDFPDGVPLGELPEGTVIEAGAISIAGQGESLPVDVEIDPDTGELILPDGELIPIVLGPTPEGAPRSIDLGDNVVAVAQTLRFPDGTTLDVGVSSPLQPVTGSLDTIRRVLWVAVPVLVLATAIISWLATSRALRPVLAVSDHARAITAENIGDRVPTPDARDEIHELAATVNAMLERLQRSQVQQRRLVADASHELRSPVAASRAQLEVARARPDAADWAATADVVLAEQERLSRLIDDLLALSRLDEAKVEVAGDVDLDEIVLEEAARHPGIASATIEAPVRIAGDATLLVRAVRNLIDNAVRHADERVSVVLGRDGAVSTIRVDDDGPGIDDADRDVVFGRFTRLDEARTRDDGGSGLGLAIAREVARAHGGDVTVGDSVLGGASFTLTVPAHLVEQGEQHEHR